MRAILKFTFLLVTLPCLFAQRDQCQCLSESVVDLQVSIKKSTEFIENVRNKDIVAGMAVGVSRNGRVVWTHASGHSDLENEVMAKTYSVFRLASISKSLTSALVGHLIEQGLIDLNKSIYKYLSTDVFPVKKWNGTNVDITVGQLMSHMAGLRQTEMPQDFNRYYGFKNATQTLSQFKDVPLLSAPGTEMHYSNYGFQVLGAVIEAALNRTYESAINEMFRQMGMNSTFCEKQNVLIPHRVRYYMRSDSTYLDETEREHDPNKVKLLPAFIADDIWSANSWHTSAGIVSTADDLLTFGNYMLDSFKGRDVTLRSGLKLLKSETIKKIWEPAVLAWPQYSHVLWNGTTYYCHAWIHMILDKEIVCDGKCRTSPIKQFYYHMGEQDGLQTILAIFPEQNLVVTVLANSNPIKQIMETALYIAKMFAL